MLALMSIAPMFSADDEGDCAARHHMDEINHAVAVCTRWTDFRQAALTADFIPLSWSYHAPCDWVPAVDDDLLAVGTRQPLCVPIGLLYHVRMFRAEEFAVVAKTAHLYHLSLRLWSNKVDIHKHTSEMTNHSLVTTLSETVVNYIGLGTIKFFGSLLNS
eukprot:m.17549 g.17549  ORF g.17549 m.17549 type:complete len:160 (-) comp11256_c0_seq1:1607-2086(-)